MEAGKVKVSSNICCLGVDYVGVVSSCVIANMCPSVNVAVIDFDTKRISLWNTRPIPSREPELDEIIRKNVNKNLIFTADVEGAINGANIIFLSRNAPAYSEGEGEDIPLDIMDIEKAARFIAKTATSNKIIVEKSTVPVGNHELLRQILNKYKASNVQFHIISNPEFFCAGTAVQNLMSPERVIIGKDDTQKNQTPANVLASIYAQWVPAEKILTVKAASAELSKLAANAFLAQRLASVSAMSIMCEATGGDISKVVQALGKCSGIGDQYLEPTFCFGGSHLLNDVQCLICMCESLNLPTVADYWREILKINEYQRNSFRKKILSSFFDNIKNKKLAIWGFSYKKNVQIADDSPAISICKSLLNEGAKLSIYDPKVEKRYLLETLGKALGTTGWEKDVVVCDDAYSTCQRAHAIVCCTDWDEFKTLNFASITKDMMRPPYIFDGRKYLPHEHLISLGFRVETIGKKFKHDGPGDIPFHQF